MTLLLALVISGFVIALGGLMYGVLAVGIPYPDPTPAQAAAEGGSSALLDWRRSKYAAWCGPAPPQLLDQTAESIS